MLYITGVMLIQIMRIQLQPGIGPWRNSKIKGLVDGRRQHKTFVVVDMLADQVDPAGGADDEGWGGAGYLLKLVDDLVQEILGAVALWLNNRR